MYLHEYLKKIHKQIYKNLPLFDKQMTYIILHFNDKLAIKVNYVYVQNFNLHTI